MELSIEEQMRKRVAEIREKRVATLVGSYQLMQLVYPDIAKCTALHDGLVAATVEDYLRDRQALINRHNITQRIQRHKVAGLMAAAIVKNKPIQLTSFDESTSCRISKDNQMLAVLHGLAICAEGKDDQIKAIKQVPFIHEWFSDFVYLLHRHPSNTESFILIFQTLSISYFPDNLKH